MGHQTTRGAMNMRQTWPAWAALCLLLALASQSCKPSPTSDAEGTAPPEATTDGSSVDEQHAGPDEDTNAADATRWDLAALKIRWAQAGWAIDDEAPELPSIATPTGTKVEGLALQRDDVRGELFLYTYPKEGYARAHEHAEVPHSAAHRYDAQLIMVYASDADRAQALLDALKLP